jgi:hypothetical protein
VERGFLVLLVMLVVVVLTVPAGTRADGYDLRLIARRCIGRITDDGGSEEDLTPAAPADYGEKSVARAMLLSAAIPGLGQIYAGGKRGYVVGGTMAAVDAFSVWQYFSNNGKGDDKKGDYELWADKHYKRDRFYEYVCDTVVVYSGYEAFSVCADPARCQNAECKDAVDEAFPLSKQSDGLFYEQIGVEDKYVFGWDDWDPYGRENHEDLWLGWVPSEPLPEGIPDASKNRDIYNGMRKDADDYYSSADRFAWIMVVGRVVSMVDAAILVKLRNRDLAGFGSNPRLTFDASLRGDPNFKVALKMRF